MKSKQFLKNLNFLASEEREKKLRKETNIFLRELKNNISEKNRDVQIFLGGSFGKRTLVDSKEIEVDIFVRFREDKNNLSEILFKILQNAFRDERVEKIHGSRDYFKIKRKDITYEIIPVKKISSARKAENVTDLSYFHTKYLNKKLNYRLRKEISIAKKFCKSAGVYGAESYIGGFSGYALECLIVHYKSFNRMISELSKYRGEKIVIDPEKHYKNPKNVFFEMNESRIKSPVILVDPTWKERNVLAALSDESFSIFLKRIREFVRKPSEKFFVEEEFDSKKFFRSGGNNYRIELETNRQEGDIAGTKMKKFSKWITERIQKNFEIIQKKFNYGGGKKSDIFISVKPKKEIIRVGPNTEDRLNSQNFRRANKKVFQRGGRLYCSEDLEKDFETFFKRFYEKNRKIFYDMGIVTAKVFVE